MKIRQIDADVLRQLFIIALILIIGYVLVVNLTFFIPGALGAVTLYVLYRNKYIYLVEKRGWKRSLASMFFILISLAAIALPIWLLVKILVPQINSVVSNKEMITDKFNAVKTFLASKPMLRNINLSEQAIAGYASKLTSILPKILNSVSSVFANLATALFILYFMQVTYEGLEKKASLYMPFSSRNKQNIWEETKMMVKSNALGIPILGLCQGLVAALGYWIFGVNNPLLWGLITGAATIVPVIGTMLVWVPIVVIQLATDNVTYGIILALYSLVVVGGTDNILRFTILKRLGNVPPLITVFGVIVGLNLFGVMGLIFGPLLMSYFLILLKVYRTEFGPATATEVQIASDKNVTVEIEPEENKTSITEKEPPDLNS
ncbi:AI-2E family transporter [Niabella terrae]